MYQRYIFIWALIVRSIITPKNNAYTTSSLLLLVIQQYIYKIEYLYIYIIYPSFYVINLYPFMMCGVMVLE